MRNTEFYLSAFQIEIDRASESRKPHLQRILDVFKANSAAPASSAKSRHGAFPGGLIAHSYTLFEIALKLSNVADQRRERYKDELPGWGRDPMAFSAAFNDLTPESILTAALLHDLNKLRDFMGRPYYVPNILKSGKVSDAKPWEVSDQSNPLACLHERIKGLGDGAEPWMSVFLQAGEGIQVRDGLVSLALAEQVSPGIAASLTPSERQAIIFHDGAYAGRTDLTGNESLLMIVIHAADMICSRYLC